MHIVAMILAAAVAAPQAPGPWLCQDGDAILVCMENLAKEPKQAVETKNAQAKPAAASGVNAQVHATPTGADTTAGTASSNTKDFLSWFSTFLQSASLDSKQQELHLVLSPTAFVQQPPPFDLQLQGIVHQPQLFASLKQALVAAGDSSRADQLQSTLNDLNDVEAVASLGFAGQFLGTNYGRHFESYQKPFEELFDATFDAAVRQPGAVAARSAASALQDRVAALTAVTPAALKRGVLLMGDLSVPDRMSVEREIMSVAGLWAAKLAAMDAAIKDNELALYSDLVSNQPQLTAAVSYRHRGTLVGPPEVSTDLSWEYSGTNVNEFLATPLAQAAKLSGSHDDWLKAWNAYKTDAHAGIKAERRLKFSLQYSSIDRYTAPVQPGNISVSAAQGRRFTGSLTYGQVLWSDASGPRGRVDLLAEYDNYSDDPLHRDRGVASLTYTQKISDTFSLPIGIAYANHADFLSDVQERFTAHFGIRVKAFSQSTSSAGGQ